MQLACPLKHVTTVHHTPIACPFPSLLSPPAFFNLAPTHQPQPARSTLNTSITIIKITRFKAAELVTHISGKWAGTLGPKPRHLQLHVDRVPASVLSERCELIAEAKAVVKMVRKTERKAMIVEIRLSVRKERRGC